ncbi:MAG: hypothetical protein ACK5B9_09990 [Flavobacteriia bacterium]|jgi:hypothetical protein
MKIKTFQFFYFIYISFVLNGCKAQQVSNNIGNENVLVFKVAYKSNKQIDHEPVGYALIDFNKLDSFKLKDDSIKNSPNVIYNITYNGGFYISEAFTDIYTLGCCEYGEVEKAVTGNVNKTISESKLKDYKGVEKLSLKLLQDNNGLSYNFQEKEANYTVTVWSVKLNYCICNLYMETPRQAIFGKKAAYIKSITSIKKPEKKIEKKISLLLKELIRLDAKYQL